MSRGPAPLAGALLVALGLSTPSCLSVTWQRTTSQHALTEQALANLPPHGASLAECLAQLGAPVLVREHRVHGLVLVYAWENDRSLGLSLSVPLGDRSASLAFTDARLRAHGIALWFDDDWTLTRWQRGRFADLVATTNVRPATVEEIEEEARVNG